MQLEKLQTEMSRSSQNHYFHQFSGFLILWIVTITIYSSKAEYQNTNNWESFKAAHVLNPAVESDRNYFTWTPREWRAWLSDRKYTLNKVKTNLDAMHNPIRHQPLKHIDAVVIANSSEILDAFKGKLTPYGRRNQAVVWSNKPFPTFVIQRPGKAFRVYNCGKIYIAARLYKGEPVHLQDYYPEIIRNSFGGHLLYPVSQNCQRIYSAGRYRTRISRIPR